MRAIFRICGNESQPGLQLVEKLVTPPDLIFYPGYCYSLHVNDVWGIALARDNPRTRRETGRINNHLFVRLHGESLDSLLRGIK